MIPQNCGNANGLPCDNFTSSIEDFEPEYILDAGYSYSKIEFLKYPIRVVRTAAVEYIAQDVLLALDLDETDFAEVPDQYKSWRYAYHADNYGQLNLLDHCKVATLNREGVYYLHCLANKKISRQFDRLHQLHQ